MPWQRLAEEETMVVAVVPTVMPVVPTVMTVVMGELEADG
jgi:uncharacterized protein YqgC (DUF456 family)